MILFASRPHTVETEPAWEGASLRAWRWAIETDRWSVGLTEQVRFGAADTWGAANHYIFAGVSTRSDVPAAGFYHVYYDGPHHTLWLWRLYMTWSWGWCTTCMPDPEEDTSGTVEEFVEELLSAAMGGAS